MGAVAGVPFGMSGCRPRRGAWSGRLGVSRSDGTGVPRLGGPPSLWCSDGVVRTDRA